MSTTIIGWVLLVWLHELGAACGRALEESFPTARVVRRRTIGRRR